MPKGEGVCPGEGGVCPGVGVIAQGISAGGVYTSPRGQTDTSENITFPQLLLPTVMMAKFNFSFFRRFRVSFVGQLN